MRYSVKRCGNNGRIRRNVPTFCHSDRSVSGVEESTTLVKEPTQGKICNSRRFLGSLRSLGMTYRYVIPFNHTGYNRNVAGGRLPPLHTQPLCAYCSYNEKRRTAPHPPPTAVPLPRRGRSWRSTSAPVVAAMRNVVLRLFGKQRGCLKTIFQNRSRQPLFLTHAREKATN